MTAGELTPVLYYLRQVGGDASPADRLLLERFVRRRDGGAFEALLRRHGPMVLGVCRRVLHDAHEAEDAFQATFLLLVRKAPSLRQPERLGPWLHGVAYRTAVRARARAARRPTGNGRVEDLPAPPREDHLWRDLRPVLDAAIDRLPSKYRVPFILCYLEGMTNAQAAQHLGCPPGTVATRLARARARLRARLTRQGIAVGGALLGLALATRTAAAVPPVLLAATAHAVTEGAIPAAVTTLMKGVCKVMIIEKVRMMVLTLAALAAVGGAGLWTYRALAGAPLAAPADDERDPLPPPVAEPVRAAAPSIPPAVVEAAPEVSYRTANFVVTAPTRRCAQVIAEAAEHHRRQLALRWLGKELPDWAQLCRVRVTIAGPVLANPDTRAADGSATTFHFAGEKQLVWREMHLSGSLDRILALHLPHEVTHCVLAGHFRKPIPRWADEGAALLAEDEEEQQRYDHQMGRLLDTPERLIPLTRLLPMSDYPKDVMALYAEGLSLTRFLVGRKDRRTFLAFLARGMSAGWDDAVGRFYGFDDVAALERAWMVTLVRERADMPRATNEGGTVGAPPITGMARVDEQGRLVLRIRGSVATPVSETVVHGGREQTVTRYVLVGTVTEQLLDVNKAEVYDLDGKRVKPQALTEALEHEAPVLVATDGRKVDPYHLQLIKKGTLIVVLPPAPPAPAAPPVPPVVPAN
jgi:RNA polymerase sigma factor (sigma-70 family)